MEISPGILERSCVPGEQLILCTLPNTHPVVLTIQLNVIPGVFFNNTTQFFVTKMTVEHIPFKLQTTELNFEKCLAEQFLKINPSHFPFVFFV